MSVCVSFHSCTDVISLTVSHNEHTIEFSVADGLFKRADTVVTVHLVVSGLRLDSRNYIVYLINDSLIEVVYCLCSSFESPAVLVKVAALDELRHILKLRVKTYNCRVLHFDNLFYKSVK